jgi:hypothetical protein
VRESNIVRANIVRVGTRAIFVPFTRKPAPQRRADARDSRVLLFTHGLKSSRIRRDSRFAIQSNPTLCRDISKVVRRCAG